VTNAAKLTVAVARIALPPIPAPGEKISHEELLDPVVDPQSLSDESSTWKAIIASVPESAARLTERSDLAKRLLVGFVAAGTLILTAGSIAVVVQGHFLIHSTVVAGLVTVICAFRSRLYAERWCAWWLLAASVAIPIGVMARYCLWFPGWAWAAVAVFIVLAIAALVLVGATEGIRRVSPVVRRVLELVDGIAIAAVIPLLLWIAGVYDIMIAGLVTDIGSAVSHGAVVAREYGLPAVVNTRIATRVFSTGDRVVLDGESGVVRLAEAQPGRSAP
jgi:type VII secretion integral membrane protein EccD